MAKYKKIEWTIIYGKFINIYYMKITYEERKEIIKICKEYNIKNYTIRDDGTVDVKGDVYLSFRDLKELPIKFGIVIGNFYCNNNQLTSLVGSPKELVGIFDCYKNQLTSLVGAPEKVGDNFYCSNNQLTSLKGAPLIVEGYFDCHNNKIELEPPLTKISGKFINI